MLRWAYAETHAGRYRLAVSRRRLWLLVTSSPGWRLCSSIGAARAADQLRPGILRARFVPRGARLMGGGKRLSRPPGTGAASRLAPRPGRRRLAERCPSSPDRRHEMSKIRWLLAPLGMALIGLAPILGATPPAWSHRLVILRHACGGRHAPRCRVGRAAAAPARPRPLGRPTRAQTRGHDPDLTGSKRSGGR